MRRLTIADIAAAAGVSTGAVSYALNGRPGVSPATRERILRTARELGWRPSTAARALTGGRSGAIGLVVDRPAHVLGVEPFFMRLISGIEARLAEGSGTALLLQVAADPEGEMAAYTDWWAERRVDGVLLVDLRADDPRLPLVRRIGLPAVALGYPPADGGSGVPCVWDDEGAGIREAVGYLAALGHRRVARVAGPAVFAHTVRRDAAFTAAAAAFGVAAAPPVHTDYSGEEGARATRRLLAGADRPTAIVYDNDIMALASMGAAGEMGVDVPAELSLVAGDDSAICRLTRPALTALTRDVPEHGRLAASALLRLVAGEEVGHVPTPPPVLTPRASTAPAPGPR
ncbi:LacI family DNA-binding transcriptional regulator [Nocardiopsis trehalosi]|uniref:LacI family DNA-binding transcriptional regulator n=1 Tax=Nocardiopsis trehalosi TaxID=109329 RepID=UPI000833003F|nr:LacI family DNA-binding transcriptional regulator [Nocardiopsis trehalosi]